MEGEIRIVLLGKTGSGKSATGNTILGEKKFNSTVSGSSVTSNCSQECAVRFDRKILIVDTPGIFDTQQSNEKIQHEIVKCMGITSPGPHAFVLVLSTSRYTAEEHNSVKHFVKYFGDEIYKYFIVLFTRKDELDAEKMTLNDHIATLPPYLKMILQKCGDRVIAFNNKLTGEEMDQQVLTLLSMILGNVQKSDCKYYTNEMYKEAERHIQQMEEKELNIAKEQRDKELKEIEEKFAKQYQEKFEAREKKLRVAELQIQDMIKKQQEDEKRSNVLKQEVHRLENMMIDSRSMETTGLKQAIESLQCEIFDSNRAREQYENKIKNMKEEYNKEKIVFENNLKKESEKREDMERHIYQQFSRLNDIIRDLSREMIEQGKGVWTKIADRAKDAWNGLWN